MPKIYNVKLVSCWEGGTLVRYPVLCSTEARETKKLFKLDGKNGDFHWATNLPKEDRYLSPGAAWEFWLDGAQASVNYFEQGLNDAIILRDKGIEQSKVDCRG
jgi:hypothetical protein